MARRLRPGTTLYNLVERNWDELRLSPSTMPRRSSYSGTKGGNTLTTKTLTVTSTTTVQDLIDFVDQASGIQPPSADPTDPITGNPGGAQ